MDIKPIRDLRRDETPRSVVVLAETDTYGVCVIKYADKHLLQNERHALEKMGKTAYVPHLFRATDTMIVMEFIHYDVVTDPGEFMQHYDTLIMMLGVAGLRHGNLTKYSVLVRDNTPILIDWAASRADGDPRPDKRPEGDAYWLRETMKQLAGIE